MAYQGKTYTLEGHEKFDEFLSALGVPQDKIKGINSSKGTLSLSKDGNTFTRTTHNQTLTFQSGVEFDETAANRQCKTVCVVEGDTFTQAQTFPDGNTVTFKHEFSPDKLVVTATSSAWDGVAHRYYSA